MFAVAPSLAGVRAREEWPETVPASSYLTLSTGCKSELERALDISISHAFATAVGGLSYARQCGKKCQSTGRFFDARRTVIDRKKCQLGADFPRRLENLRRFGYASGFNARVSILESRPVDSVSTPIFPRPTGGNSRVSVALLTEKADPRGKYLRGRDPRARTSVTRSAPLVSARLDRGAGFGFGFKTGARLKGA